MRKLFLLAMFAAFAMPQAAQADVVVAFEFETTGDVEGWQHNGGANGGTGGTGQATASSGEGVLTSVFTGTGSADLRVLQNPDIALPAGFTTWETLDIRFREVDGATGTPQALTGPDTSLFAGVLPGPIGTNGSGFVEETPGDSGFWYTASVDISSLVTGDIEQIRIDPIARFTSSDGLSTFNYQIDYVRLNATPEAATIPEPSSLALLGLAGVGMFVRRRK